MLFLYRAEKNLYFSLVYSSLIYCIEAYGNVKKAALKPLILKCNSLLRVLQNKPRSFRVNDLYFNYNTFILNILFKFSVLKLMHSVIFYKSELPNIFCNLFLNNGDVHSYNTRNTHTFNLQLNNKKFSIAAIGPSLWHNLPYNIKNISNRCIFISRCKEFCVV